MDVPASAFDLSRYARRIGLDAIPEPTRDGLRALIRAHALSIPFENLDAVLGRGVDLAPDAVVRKLLDQQRGGWCFEQNLLLGLALRELGLTVTDHAAQVVWFRPPGYRSPRTHRLLRVELDDGPYLADVGFGAVTLTDLLRLEPDIEQRTSHESFRLTRADGIWQLEVRLPTGWQPMYRFDLSPWWMEDFVPVNYQLAHDPQSPFVQALNVARVLPDGRLGLRDAELTRWSLAGSPSRRRLRDVAEILDVLENEFGIAARALPGIRERLAACLVPLP